MILYDCDTLQLGYSPIPRYANPMVDLQCKIFHNIEKRPLFWVRFQRLPNVSESHCLPEYRWSLCAHRDCYTLKLPQTAYSDCLLHTLPKRPPKKVCSIPKLCYHWRTVFLGSIACPKKSATIPAFSFLVQFLVQFLVCFLGSVFSSTLSLLASRLTSKLNFSFLLFILTLVLLKAACSSKSL